MTKQLLELIKKHEKQIKNNSFLPLFVDALVTGGIKLFDEVRATLEDCDVDLSTADFTKLK